MSGFGYQPPPMRLMDTTLKLSPETQAIMAKIEARIAVRHWLEQMQTPDWSALHGSYLQTKLAPPPVWALKADILAMPSAPGAASQPNYWATLTAPVVAQPEPPPFTDTPPHAGEMGDLLGALYQLPVVQAQVKLVQGEAMLQLNRMKQGFLAAPTATKVTLISGSALVVSGAMVAVLANKPTRLAAFDLIKDKWIPVPGVDGLKIQVHDDGAGVTAPLYVKGLSVEGQLHVTPASASSVMVTFDLMQFLNKGK